MNLRAEVLVERLDPRGAIHGVADHGVFLAARRADVAGDDVAEMQADADPQRPVMAVIVARHRIAAFLARR